MCFPQVALPTTAAEIIVTLDKPGAEVSIQLGHTNFAGLAVQVSATEGLEIVRGEADTDGARFRARGARPTTIRVFLDVGSIEVVILIIKINK